MNPTVGPANDPDEWGKIWTDTSNKEHTGHVNPWYPTDGRDTIYPLYERFAPTGTVGEYIAAGQRVGATDPNLPPHYASYLAQRTDIPYDKLDIFSPDTPLDAKGHPVW